MDGAAVNLVDVNGNPVEPFAINGTTYLPVRAVAGALGLDVGWDQATTTVALTSEKQMTLDLSFGTRTGTYTGEVNADGVPSGRGVFTATNENGVTWSYNGSWVDGHYSGPGVTTWDNGQTLSGLFENDCICGPGVYHFPNGTSFCGQFTDSLNAKGVYIDEEGNTFLGEIIDGGITWDSE